MPKVIPKRGKKDKELSSYLALSKDDVEKLTQKQRDEILKVLEAKYEEKLRLRQEIVNQNPFYFYEPDRGEITPERRAFLARWLKPEDIPLKLDSQFEALSSDKEVKLISGGNQSGKSTTEAIEDYIDVTKQVPEPLKGLYPVEQIPKKTPFHIRTTGVDHKQLLNTVIPAYRFWCPRDFLKDGSWEKSFSSEQRLLTLSKGGKLYGTIEFMTNQMDVESFQGPPKDKQNYDEEPRQDIYKENMMRFVTAEKIRVRFHMTPTKGMTWVKQEIYDNREGKANVGCYFLPSVCNPKANLEVVEEILKGLTSYDEIKMRLLGEFISLSGLVYGKLFSRKVHIIDPFPIDYDNFVVYRGGDPHLVKPSVFVELAVDREENKYVVGVYSKDCDTAEIKKDLAERVKSKGKDSRGWRVAQTRVDKSCDSTIKVLGDRNVFLELSRGENAIPAMVTSDKFTGSINAGVDIIKQELKVNEKTSKPTLFFFDTPEVWKLVQAMETMERDMASDEDRKGVRDKILEGRWDAHAAMRYIFQGPIRYIPAHTEIPQYEQERYI